MGLIITGLSGSGKSTALHALEDVGCFCTDNLPLPLLAGWASEVAGEGREMAVCVDIRSASPDALHRELARLRSQRKGWKLVFLEADDAALLRRFSTVRRRHPYAPDEELPQAIALERQSLAPLRDSADLVINTSALNPYELAERVESFWRRQADKAADTSELIVMLMSFSYRCGVPPEADMVIDARFLPNPHYDAGLAKLTGRDAPVIGFLQRHAEVAEAERRLCDWLDFIWPHMRRERKRYFTLAVGCSGGRHRSVYLVERLARHIHERTGEAPLIRHRELSR